MFELDYMVTDFELPSLDKLSAKCRHEVELAVSVLVGMGQKDRCRSYDIGEQVAKILDAVSAEDKELAAEVTKSIRSNRSVSTSLKIFRKFNGHRNLLPLIQSRVQQRAATSATSARADDVIALAQDGREVTMEVYEQQVLPHYTGAADSVEPWETTEETQPASVGDESESDADPDPSPAPPSIAEVVETESVDFSIERDGMIRLCTSRIGAELRRIDDFCREKKIIRAGWYHKVDKGCELLLSGLREWGMGDG